MGWRSIKYAIIINPLPLTGRESLTISINHQMVASGDHSVAVRDGDDANKLLG